MKMALSIICGVLITLLASKTYANEPTCHPHSSGPYCQYVGTVKQVYVNVANRILVYFDTPLDLSSPSSVGISGVTRSDATTLIIDANPTFAQYFYSAVLAAQASGKQIRIQMRGANAGYLVVDRIWVLD